MAKGTVARWLVGMVEVHYFNCTSDAQGNQAKQLLGREVFDGVTEALIPGWGAAKTVFFTKRFQSTPHHLWRVERVTPASAAGVSPVIYEVYLSYSAPSFAEEYLYQTLKKDRPKSTFKLLRKGTLVEVDYGFPQNVARDDRQVKSNKRYSDTLQNAEMHKRRLAVVVKVISSNLVQVAPVTSKGTVGDKSEFQLTQATVDRLPRYKDSGYSSYVLCNRIEAVSTQRILPPLSYDKQGRKARYTSYPVALSAHELNELKSSMLIAIGISDYSPQHRLRAAEKQAEAYEVRIAELEDRIAALQSENVTVTGLCRDWALQVGRDYDEELEFWRALQAEQQAEPIGCALSAAVDGTVNDA